MRIRYIVPVSNKRKVIIPGHWQFPVLGGEVRVVEKNGCVAALEVIYSNQGTELSPSIEEDCDEDIKYSIVNSDPHLPFVKAILSDAMSFLQCYFGISLSLDDVEVRYEGETPVEEGEIKIKSVQVGKYEEPLVLTFDMLTRAVAASERGGGPKFEAALICAARDALAEQRFIDSFRYSFLLIEFIYGDGQFKGAGLKAALKKSTELRAIAERVISEKRWIFGGPYSDTMDFLNNGPSADDLIDHLVDKRGFYFHGNLKRKDAWKPEKQGATKVLAFVAIDIASSVAQQAAGSMFDEQMNRRHVEYAENAGAQFMVNVKYSYRIPGEAFLRDGQLDVHVLGTKVTPRLAVGVAQKFLQHFEHHLPTAELNHVAGAAQEEKIFDMKFYTDPKADGGN